VNKISSLREYYKYLVFSFFNGFGGTVWGAFTYFIAVPVAYLVYFKANSMHIGLLTTIFWSGFALPGIWAAYVSETQRIKKVFVAKMMFLSSISWLILGIYILVTKNANPHMSIWLFLIFFAWACFFSGLLLPANFTMIFKIIPTERLGQLMGIMMAIQFIAFVVAGPVIKKISTMFHEPANYAILFLATFVISLVCVLLLLTIKEPEGEKIEGSPSFRMYLGRCIEIIKTDTIFNRFIVGKWLMSGHYIMMAFLLVYLMKERGYDPLNTGWFLSCNALGLFIGGFTITRISDRYGPKYLLISSQVFAILYTILIWLIPTSGMVIFYIGFIITGLAQISDNVGFNSMYLLCCPTADKSTYMAVTLIGINLITIPLPFIIGKLIDNGIFTYSRTFTLSFIMMIVAILYLITIVKNPKAFYDMRSASAKN
jgi:MFS family permease